jgi:5-formyltetrahydrofolate cyclo-ligase
MATMSPWARTTPSKQELRLAARSRRDPARVAVYESLPDEPPTGPLIERLLAAGHEVVVPVVLEDFSLQWRYAVEGTTGDHGTVTRRRGPVTDRERSTWLGTDALAGCDLVVAPALSVDARGTRLGQGGGCYDRALVHRDPAAPVVVLLHEGEQSDADLPRDEHDLPVDGVITTTGRLVRIR